MVLAFCFETSSACCLLVCWLWDQAVCFKQTEQPLRRRLWQVDLLWTCGNVDWAPLGCEDASVSVWHGEQLKGERRLWQPFLEGGRRKKMSLFYSTISYLPLPNDISWTWERNLYYSVSKGKPPFAKKPWSVISKGGRHFFLCSQVSTGPHGAQTLYPRRNIFWRVWETAVDLTY